MASVLGPPLPPPPLLGGWSALTGSMLMGRALVTQRRRGDTSGAYKLTPVCCR